LYNTVQQLYNSCTLASMRCANKLEETIKKAFQVDKVVYPSEAILRELDMSRATFRRLLKNEKVMSAHEAVVLAEWLDVDVRELLNLSYERESVSLHQEGCANA
jgi:plasmid maintenance system antidote protein VapI